MRTHWIKKTLHQYQGCLTPLVTVAIALGILIFLAIILGDLHTTKIHFTAVNGLPDNLDLQRSYELASVSFWWLFLVYAVWIAACISVISGFAIVHQSLANSNSRSRRKALAVLAISLIGLAFILYQANVTFISAQDIIMHVARIATGMRTLIEMTTAVAIIALFSVLVCTSIILCPAHNKADIARKMRLLNILLYIGATVLILWVMQSRALYSFAAASLISEQQIKVEQIAPTISLVVGGFASILLGLMYVSSYLWLQNTYQRHVDGKQEMDNTEKVEDKHNPGHIFLRSWTRVIAIIGPMLPGIFEVFSKFDNLV